jgi:hypothetical protein
MRYMMNEDIEKLDKATKELTKATGELEKRPKN